MVKQNNFQCNNPNASVVFKSNLSLYSMYYAEACNEFSGTTQRHRAQATQLRPFQEMLQWWRAIGNTVSDLISQRFEPKTSRS